MNNLADLVKQFFTKCKILFLICFNHQKYNNHNNKELTQAKTLDRLNKRHIIRYHYCSVETFHKIIEFKKMWLSNSEYMNDKFESIWIDERVDEILNDIGDSIANDRIEKFKKLYDSIPSKNHYLCSFSKSGDILSQWRAYGNDGQGIAIGFNFALFPELLDIYSKSPGTINGKSSTHKLGYEDVSYTDIMLTKYILNILRDENNFENEIPIIKELATLMKHPSFIEEKEIRLTYTPENNKHSMVDKSLERLSEIKYRSLNHNLVSYYELNFDSKYNSLLIPKIILGPKCNIDKSELRGFLNSCDFKDTEIKNSESSYR